MTPGARKAAQAPTAPAAPDPQIAGLGYEQARDALVEVVRRLESGGATLEESLELWERGEELATRCEQWLHGARARLDSAGPPEPDDVPTDGPAALASGGQGIGDGG